MTAQQGHKKQSHLTTMLKHYTRYEQELDDRVMITEESQESMNED